MKQTYLRMDDDFHKELRHEAAEDDVSLNTCITTLLQEALAARRAVRIAARRALHWASDIWLKEKNKTIPDRRSQTGTKNHRWKGTKASNYAFHQRVYKRFGYANTHICSECGKCAQEWANTTGNYADVFDYAPMCRSCHRRYDIARRQASQTAEAIKVVNVHEANDSTYA